MPTPEELHRGHVEWGLTCALHHARDGEGVLTLAEIAAILEEELGDDSMVLAELIINRTNK